MQVSVLLGISGFALFLVIYWYGWRKKLIRHFPIFYLYVALSSLGSLLLWVYYFAGVNENSYAHAYNILLLLRQSLEIAILAKLYMRFRSRADLRMWQLLTAMTGSMAVALLTQKHIGTYEFTVAALLQFQILFCALTLGHVALNRRVSIGWNQFVIVSGLAISIFFKYIGWALVASSVIQYDLLRPWIQPIEIVPWIIWAISMREYSPTREISEAQASQIEAQRREYEKAVRSLLQR